jgi:hypothetical protein
MIEEFKKVSGTVDVEHGGKTYEVDYVADIGDFDSVEIENVWDAEDGDVDAIHEEAERLALEDARKQLSESDARGTAPGLSKRTLEVVLAALRYMQADLETYGQEIPKAQSVADILESGPTTPGEINRICEELNTHGPDGKCPVCGGDCTDAGSFNVDHLVCEQQCSCENGHTWFDRYELVGSEVVDESTEPPEKVDPPPPGSAACPVCGSIWLDHAHAGSCCEDERG